MKDYLDIILGVAAIVGAIYRIAQVESNINARLARLQTKIDASVDVLKDTLLEKINSITQRIEIHLTEYQGKKEYLDYRIHDLEKDNLSERLNSMQDRLNIHLTEYQGRKEHYDYRIHDFDNRLQHKFNRLRDLIKQLAGFLNKQSGFVMRDDEY